MTIVASNDPRILSVEVTDDLITAHLADGPATTPRPRSTPPKHGIRSRGGALQSSRSSEDARMRRTIGMLIATAALVLFWAKAAHGFVVAGQVAPAFTKSVLDSGITRSLSEYQGRVVIVFQLGYS